MDVFFFSVSNKFFEPTKDLMFSFSVHLLLYMLLNLYILILSELFRYTMIRLLEVARVPTAINYCEDWHATVSLNTMQGTERTKPKRTQI